MKKIDNNSHGLRWGALAFLAVGTMAAQNQQVTVLEFDTVNQMGYEIDTFDYPQLGTSASEVPRKAPRVFGDFVQVGDVVFVNGKPAKGVLVFRSTRISLTTVPATGQNFADVTRGTVAQWDLEILANDGSPIGSLMAIGLPNGDPPPGAPLKSISHNMAIVGGTGAFLGARGQIGQALAPFMSSAANTFRTLSAVTDPATRRERGAGVFGWVAHFTVMNPPSVLANAGVPAIVHSSDFRPVTPANPAKPGEVLSLLARNLGPTKPGLDPGQLFAASPLAIVNSTVEILVGGQPAQVLYAGGYPGTNDTYQVNFRLPAALSGTAPQLQLSVAWNPAPPVTLALQ